MELKKYYNKKEKVGIFMHNLKKLIFMLLLSVFCVSWVSAEETILTCEYYKAADTLSPYPGNQQVGVLCDVYDDYTHQCYMEVGSESATRNSNKESVLNWNTSVENDWQAKEYVKDNNGCPSYLSIRLENGAIFNIGGYEIYMAENLESLIELNKKLSNQRYPATLKGMQISNENKKKAEENIKKYTEMINSQIRSYSIQSCAKEENTITRYEECKEIVSNLKSNISTWDVNVHNYINQGYFNEEDTIIKDYRRAVNNAEFFLEQSEKELEEKNKEIQEELGILDEKKSEVHISFCDNKGVKGTLKLIGNLLLIAKIIIPIILIIFGIIEFTKALTSADNDAISKATKSFILKIISAIIIFILPTLINFIFSSIVKEGSDYNQCRRCIFNRNC